MLHRSMTAHHLLKDFNILFVISELPSYFRLRAHGQPFIAFDPGLTRDALAYYGCAELFQVPAPIP